MAPATDKRRHLSPLQGSARATDDHVRAPPEPEACVTQAAATQRDGRVEGVPVTFRNRSQRVEHRATHPACEVSVSALVAGAFAWSSGVAHDHERFTGVSRGSHDCRRDPTPTSFSIGLVPWRLRLRLLVGRRYGDLSRRCLSSPAGPDLQAFPLGPLDRRLQITFVVQT